MRYYLISKRIKIGLSYNAPHTQLWLENDNKNNDLFVFGFEPNPFNFSNILNKNIIPYHNSKPLQNEFINDNYICLIPAALSNVNEKIYMDFYNMNNDGGTSSLFCPKDNRLGPVKQITKVPVFSLKHFFDIYIIQIG